MHEAGGGEFGGEEAFGVAYCGSCGEATAADRAFHGGGPLGGGPVTGEVEAGPLRCLRGTVPVEVRDYGEGGSGFLEDSAFEKGGLFRGGEEGFELAESGGENLFPAHLKLWP